MSSEVVLKVQNVGKRYAMILFKKFTGNYDSPSRHLREDNKDLGEIYEAPHHRLLQTLLRGRKQFYKEFSPSLNFPFMEGTWTAPISDSLKLISIETGH